MTRYDRPRGTRDFGSDEMARRRWLEVSFRETMRRFGYREIQTPTFESTELFKAKSGPNIVDEIYEFMDKGGRSVCLRPELTAPVMRFYVNDLTHEPKPLKMYYYGPCFRYEEPQEGRYREFWQFGLELVGPEGPSADAEVVAVAHAALVDAGLSNFILHVGHIGVLRALVDALPADAKQKAETFRRVDKDDAGLEDFLDGLQAPAALSHAIAACARHERRLELDDAASVSAYFDEARAFLKPAFDDDAWQRAEKHLTDLRESLTLLGALGVPALHVDLGVARGLDYYTGMVFELEAPDLGAQKQIGGGGAYTLAELFGGEHVGSAGFGLGFDRILLALDRENAVPAPPPAADVHVAVLGAGARAPALALATQLRAVGVSVDADLMGRSLSKALAHAAKQRAKLALIVGEKDLATGKITIRDMESGAQDAVPLAEAVAAVRTKLA